MLAAATNLGYPSWLNPADNTWQLVAATLVGLMSLPGLAILYCGLVQKKWVVNTMLMAFGGFSLVLIVWVLWAYNMGFGVFAHLGATGSFWSGLVGKPHPIVSHFGEQNQASSTARRPSFRGTSPTRPWRISSSCSPPSRPCCSWAASSGG